MAVTMQHVGQGEQYLFAIDQQEFHLWWLVTAPENTNKMCSETGPQL
jgi:hypothetical protein